MTDTQSLHYIRVLRYFCRRVLRVVLSVDLSTVLFCRNAGESASCTVIFVIVYYFTMAGVIWFTILAFTWHRTFRSFNSKRDVIEGHKGYFHLAAWCLPLVLTIVCLAVTQVSTSDLSLKVTVS